MKIHDISQELFSCEVYPGDRAPEKIEELRMAQGSLYNLTSFSMCAHNGTHVDAPFHFYREGKTVEQLPLSKFVGPCVVLDAEGCLGEAEAKSLLCQARCHGEDAARKILLRGDATVMLPAAEVFAQAGLDLLGVESQSVGPVEAPMAVHLALLGVECVLLEGLRLQEVSEGRYFLCAAPIDLAGSDGAPCRALLVEG